MEAREWQPLWRLGKDLDSDTGRKICFTNCNDHPRGVSCFEREDFSWSRHRQQLLNEKRRARTWSPIRPWWGLESPSPPRQRDNHIPGLTDRHCPSQKQTHWDSSQPPDGGLSSDKKRQSEQLTLIFLPKWPSRCMSGLSWRQDRKSSDERKTD